MYGSAYYLIQQIIWNDMQQRANYVKFIRVSEVWGTFFYFILFYFLLLLLHFTFAFGLHKQRLFCTLK